MGRLRQARGNLKTTHGTHLVDLILRKHLIQTSRLPLCGIPYAFCERADALEKGFTEDVDCLVVYKRPLMIRCLQ